MDFMDKPRLQLLGEKVILQVHLYTKSGNITFLPILNFKGVETHTFQVEGLLPLEEFLPSGWKTKKIQVCWVSEWAAGDKKI